jgi:heme A synthase
MSKQTKAENQPELGLNVDRSFARLALWTAIMTLLMIIIGAITRVSESGMGCGTYWPDCNGRLIPEFNDIHTVIEFGHRLFAPVVGLFALAVLVQAWRRHRHDPLVLVPAVLGFVLYFVQAGLGQVTVITSNQWVSVLLHLGNSMLLLACYLVAWANARRLGASDDAPRLPLSELLPTTALTLVVALVGAAVAGNNATKACVGWPLCAGQIWPAEQGPLQLLNMLHRIAAGSLGLMLVLMLIQTMRGGGGQTMRRVLWSAIALYVGQAALGALVVLVNGREMLVIVRSLHVVFAAATWSIMVIASTVSWLQRPSIRVTASQSGPVGMPSATTSS